MHNCSAPWHTSDKKKGRVCRLEGNRVMLQLFLIWVSGESGLHQLLKSSSVNFVQNPLILRHKLRLCLKTGKAEKACVQTLFINKSEIQSTASGMLSLRTDHSLENSRKYIDISIISFKQIKLIELACGAFELNK